MKYVYYAHHLFKYDTRIEQYELALIERDLPGYSIINPNGDIEHADMTDEARIMEKCLATVEREDVAAVVFSSINGVVGKGVYDEVRHAQALGKPIYYVTDHQVRSYEDLRFLVFNESKRLYAIVQI